MEHPFITDLSDKSLEELQETISSLHNKLTFAYRTQNAPVSRQINMVIESYRNAYNKKMDEMISKQNIKSQINIQK
jgi:iron-sulfur cluster repair protein YtfE (RIC family)